MLGAAPGGGFMDASTAAYGSAYCIVRLTAGWGIPLGLSGGGGGDEGGGGVVDRHFVL